MSKVAIIADQHFGTRGDNQNFHEYFKKYYSEHFFPYLVNNDIKTVISLGDTFDRRKYINFETLERTKEYWFNIVESLGLEYHVLVGNHDTYYKSTNRVNSIDLLLEDSGKIRIYSNPEVINVDGLDILMMPWINKENYDESVKLLKEWAGRVVFGHFEIQGFEMYRGIANRDGFSRRIFKKFDLVLSGHFHHKSSYDNITYPGAPYEMTWNDYNDPKGFHILDTETLDLTFVQNPYILFNKILYNDLIDDETILKKDYSYIKDTYVKVIIKNKENHYLFDLFIDKLNSFDPAHLQTVEDNFNLDLENDDDLLDEIEDTQTIMTTYINQLSIPDKDDIVKLIIDLYQEALTVG